MIQTLFFDNYPTPLPNFPEWYDPDAEDDEE